MFKALEYLLWPEGREGECVGPDVFRGSRRLSM